MRTFLVNLMPPEIGDRVRSRGESRRMGLLVALLLLSLVGVSLHSWDQSRRARAVRDASVISRERLDDVENELGRLELERQRLATFMTTYRSVSLPMEMSDLVATIVNRMPENSSLTDLSIKVDSRLVAPAPGAAPVGPGSPAAPAPTPRRILVLRVRGFALSNTEVTAFERALAAAAPFSSAKLDENRSMETPEGHFQEFVITAEIPLDRAYTTPRDGLPLAFDAPKRVGEPMR